MGEIFCYHIDMPYAIRGTSVINPDGSITIYINTKLNNEQQLRAYKHELRHIKKNDFYNNESIHLIERCRHERTR